MVAFEVWFEYTPGELVPLNETWGNRVFLSEASAAAAVLEYNAAASAYKITKYWLKDVVFR